MPFKYIDLELTARGLTPIPFNALCPDDEEYSIFLNQHFGTVGATPDFIGNSLATHHLAIEKFTEFLKIANAKSYDLALTPEYSCPWQVVELAVRTNILPLPGKLWVLGCESITPSELTSIVERFPEIVWIFESGLTEDGEKKFLDPVCHLFKAKRDDKLIDVCVIQFKYQHMSVHLSYREKDYLIEGTISYIFRNVGSTINLLTLICSESLNFNATSLVNLNLDKLLVIHLQMNLVPRHPIFKDYRNTIFNGESIHVEVICLNWARGTDILGHKITFSGSAYYLKSDKPLLTDHRLDQNQDKGLFYCYWKDKRSHVFFLVSDEYLICLKTHKASQVLASGPIRRRDGPQAIESYQWLDNAYCERRPRDNFKLHCDSLTCNFGPLLHLGNTDKERFLKLASGINLNANWYNVLYLNFFSVSDDEIINRLTYTDEPDLLATQNRHDYLMRLKELVTCFTTRSGIPPELSTLATDSKIFYSIGKNAYSNVFSTLNGNPIGTIIYLGPNVMTKAKEVFDNVKKLYLASIQNTLNRGKPAILVLYIDGTLRKYFESDDSIDADIDAIGTDITKDI